VADLVGPALCIGPLFIYAAQPLLCAALRPPYAGSYLVRALFFGTRVTYWCVPSLDYGMEMIGIAAGSTGTPFPHGYSVRTDHP